MVHNLKSALGKLFRCIGMKLSKSGHCCHFFVYFRVVLHGAGTQRIKAVVDSEIHSGKLGVMAYYIQFRYSGKSTSSLQYLHPRFEIVQLKLQEYLIKPSFPSLTFQNSGAPLSSSPQQFQKLFNFVLRVFSKGHQGLFFFRKNLSSFPVNVILQAC